MSTPPLSYISGTVSGQVSQILYHGPYQIAAFGVETLEPWGPGALSLFGKISKRLVESSGDKRTESYFAQRLNIAIQHEPRRLAVLYTFVFVNVLHLI